MSARDSEARYWLRKGMARVALAHKAGAKQARDAYGHPLKAVELAERTGTKRLAQWAKGRRTSYVVL